MDRYYTPQEFEELGAIAKAKGFLLVSSSPLTRSSYHAGDDFKALRDARNRSLNIKEKSGSVLREIEVLTG